MRPHYHPPHDSFSSLDDESILLLIRYNVPSAQETLLLRHEKKKNTHFRRAIPEYVTLFDEWGRNEIFFRAFLLAESYYRFRASRFSRFFEFILRRETIKEAVTIFRDSTRTSFSLDENLPTEEGLIFHDVLPTGRVEDDPVAFLSYAEGLLAISKLPKGIHPEAVRIVKHLIDGDSFEEAGKKEGVPLGAARGMVYRYRVWAKETLEGLGRAPVKSKPKRKKRIR